MSQQLLTQQELNIASRYGYNNFSFDAFKSSSFLPQSGTNFGLASGPVPYKHQDELSGEKQTIIAGDFRSRPVDARRQKQRAALHASHNYGAPFQFPS